MIGAMSKVLSILVVLLGLSQAVPAQSFDLQAHRGGRGLRPENTLAAFENAMRMGVTTLELDIETRICPNKPNGTVGPDAFVTTLLAVIREAGMGDRVMIQSSDWRTLQLVQRLAPGMRTVFLTTQGKNGGNVGDPAWTDGIISDYPDRLREVMRERGLPLPKSLAR